MIIRVASEIEVRFTPAGRMLARWTAEHQSMSEPFECEAWQEIAESLSDRSIAVGASLHVRGRFRDRTWTDRTGEDHTKKVYVVSDWRRQEVDTAIAW